jgi:hypothetical protein
MNAVLPWVAGGLVAAGAVLAWRILRPVSAEPAPLTGYEVMGQLQRLGWTPAGAGPNYWCVYLNKGPLRIVLISSMADPFNATALQDLVTGVKQDVNAANRRIVAVYQGQLEHGLVQRGAANDVTFIYAADLARLEDALAETEGAAAVQRAAELRALTRAYEAPTPAPMAAAATPDPVGPLFETERVACFLRDRGGEELVISFANQWARYDGRAFWADAVTKTIGLSVAGFVAKEPNWYAADDMAALIPALMKRLDGRFRLRTTYGHSQGGFAALKYSRALGASTVLAFSPQYSIDARLVPDARVNKYYTGQLNAGMAIEHADTAGNLFVFYDPHDPADAQHAELIGKATPILTVPITYVGHGSDRVMSDPALFRHVLDVSRPGDVTRVRQLMARNRAARADRPVLMALALAASRPRTAAAILQKYAGGWKTDHISNVCYRLAKAGQAELALEYALRAALGDPANAHAQGAVALIAIELKRLRVAQNFITKALDLEPGQGKWLDAQRRIRQIGAEAAA